MDRRTFLIAAGASLLTPGMALAKPLDYTPGLVRDRLAKGETLFLDFKASWCTTCAAQERVLTALKSENPAYERRLTFINIDWDEFGRSDIVKRMNIPRRSTLVVLKGDAELGRIVAQTSRKQIKALMDTALQAAG